MPVIKQHNASRVASEAVVLDLGDLSQQAKRLLDEARREADRVLTAARTEAKTLIDTADERGLAEGTERGLREGRDQGRAEGREEILTDFREQIEQLASKWSDALERWEADRNAMLFAAREDVLAFAFAMARKIIVRCIDLHPDVVQDQLAETLSLVARPSSILVEIHPEDRALVEGVLPSIVSDFGGAQHASIRENDSIARGGCIVRTGDGLIDATIDTQIERIAKTLLPDQVAQTEEQAEPGAEP